MDFALKSWKMLYRLMDNVKVLMDSDFESNDGVILGKDVFQAMKYVTDGLKNIMDVMKDDKKPKDEYLSLKKEEDPNLDIFIGAYKDLNVKVSNPTYKIIYGNHEISDDEECDLKAYKCVSDEELDDRFYSEIYMLKNLPKDYKLKKYVGFCHYRKYFSFMDDIPDMDKLFSECDAVAGKPIKFKTTIKEQYSSCHNLEDLEIIGNILKEKYKGYYKSYNVFLEGKTMIPYNMFIMKRKDFSKYIKFMEGVLGEYVKIVGTDIEKRIKDNKDKYIKKIYPNNKDWYQYRIGGYLAERLTNVFFLKHFNRIKIYNIKITENKY